MKYTYTCSICGDRTIEASPDHFPPECDHGRMQRVYASPLVIYRGDGFTGAAGSLPRMDKEKRKQDLSEKKKPLD